ncbi:MAG TPA: 50S ribosomal protein L29 [Candidatus Cloacimonadota bacterium]|jgi:large subunit ribosomal protein L29|nr:50S ribosomal protein L29 [Candidatus Cloacimonadales bacterium]HPK40549.1 50S ribosomal protein L29 [Candidatus Cloacimonadota bacterium]HPY96909.1 50S ribosomal protein L29 [Candidatus Cloacimonadota bacterium]HQB40440.1 50S ribosomal protein L29 [Candidatus Cloacimonadota bacterium]
MKSAELRDLTLEDLNKRIEDLKEELFNLRIQKVRNRLENTSRIRDVRRDVARALTVLTEKNNASKRS